MTHRFSYRNRYLLGLAISLLPSCGGDEGGGSSNTGGAVGVGGNTNVGGVNATAGSKTSGGASGTNVSTASGGNVVGTSVGGVSGTGGVAFGGATSATTTPLGGSMAGGGSNASGGNAGSGGGSTIGGNASSGGGSTTGGNASSGGGSTTGGNASSGGGSTTGGFIATGGIGGVGGTTVAKYNVSVKVTGLLSSGFKVQLNQGQSGEVTFDADGSQTFAAPLDAGAAYAVTVAAQPTSPRQFCNVQNGKGAMTSATTVSVNCSQVPRYNLVVDTEDDSISTYYIECNSGRSTYIGKTDPITSTSANSNAVAAPNGIAVANTSAASYAYVISSSDTLVHEFLVNADGSLSALGTADVGIKLKSIVVDAAGTRAFTLGADVKTINRFVIGLDGKLTEGSFLVGSGTSATDLALAPTGAFAYSLGSDGLTRYRIDGTALSKLDATIACGADPIAIAFNPAGNFAYTINRGSTAISGCAVDATTGALTALPANTSVAIGSNPVAIAVEPAGTAVYVVNGGDGGAADAGNSAQGSVSQFAISDNGALSALDTPVPTESAPNSINIDPSRGYAYVTNANGDSVSQFNIAANGSLSPNAPPRVPAQVSPVAQAMVTGKACVQPYGKHAYVANGDDTLWQYGIATTGALNVLGSINVAGTGSEVIVADASAKHVYVVDGAADAVSQYAIGATGDLSPLDPETAATGSFPWTMALYPSGRYAYVLNKALGTVSQYGIGSDGALSPLNPAVMVLKNSGFVRALGIDPSGRYAYVTSTDGMITQFAVGANGTLATTPSATVATGNNPYAFAIVPSGRWLYVVNADDDTVSQYAISPDGILSALSSPAIAAGTSPQAISVDPSGKFAYVANASSGNVSQYSITASGALAAMTPGTVAVGTTDSDSPNAVTVDASGKYVYVADSQASSGSVWQYLISGNGELVPMVSPSVKTGAYAESIAIASAHK